MTPALIGLETTLRRFRRLRRIIRNLLRQVTSIGISGVFNLIRAEIQKSEPSIAGEFRDGQLRAFFQAGRRTLLGMDKLIEADRVPPPVWPRFGSLADDPLPSIRFPTIDNAVRFLSSRIPYTPQEFATLTGDARNVGFTVARALTRDAVAKIQEALVNDVRTGGTLAEFRQNIEPVLNASGLADHHVETLYRGQVGRAYSIGQERVLNDPMVADEFPYRMYSATHDSRVRPEHKALEAMGLNGTAVYRSDDPFWDIFLPPWDFGCRCNSIPLSIEDAAHYGVVEARKWERTGKPPSVPAYVTLPEFRPSASWEPVKGRLVPLIAA